MYTVFLLIQLISVPRSIPLWYKRKKLITLCSIFFYIFSITLLYSLLKINMFMKRKDTDIETQTITTDSFQPHPALHSHPDPRPSPPPSCPLLLPLHHLAAPSQIRWGSGRKRRTTEEKRSHARKRRKKRCCWWQRWDPEWGAPLPAACRVCQRRGSWWTRSLPGMSWSPSGTLQKQKLRIVIDE